MGVIYFATLFLLIDIQTPSSSPKSGKYNVSYFNFPMSVLEQIGVCPKLPRIALIFIDPFFT